jgi:hypothetical protein
LVDGHALAFIDVQDEPTYIHNPVVQEGSRVMVRCSQLSLGSPVTRPYGYGDKVVEGTPSEEVVCIPV